MPLIIRRNVIPAAVFVVAALVFMFVLFRVAGADVDAGAMVPSVATAGELDAGPAALPPSQAPHADPASDPAGALSEFQAARRSGGLQLAIGVLVAVFAGAIRTRMAPTPGQEEPPPSSWRARTVALLGVAVMLGWGVADRAAGATSWIGLATIAAAAVGLAYRAINPPKGSKATSAAPAA